MSALKKFRAEKNSAQAIADGITAVRMMPIDTFPSTHMPLPNAFTPLEQQVVDLRQNVPKNMILVIMCGYKMKCFGRDARVVSRRLGFQCMFPTNTPFEYCSFPVQRTIFHCSRLVAMGYHVGIVDQVETAAGRAATSTSSAKVFERKLTRALSKASAPDFTSLTIGSGGGGGGGGGAADDEEEGDGEGDDAAVPSAEVASPPKSAADESNFILFISENEKVTELSFVSINARIMTCKRLELEMMKEPQQQDEHNSTVAPHIQYQEEVIAALQSGLLCYSPVEIVVKSSLGRESSSTGSQQQQQNSLSPTLASVINAIAQYHIGPSDDEDAACNVLLTHFDAALEEGYSRYIKEKGLALASPQGEKDVAINKNNQNTNNNTNASLQEPIHTRAMMETYFTVFQAADALRAVSLAPYLYKQDGHTMHLPPTTLRALDIFPSSKTNGADSLFALVNRCLTSCGARRLKAMIAAPLCRLDDIQKRQAAIKELSEEVLNRKLVKTLLQQGQGADIEGTMTRLCAARCSYNEYRTFLEKMTALRTKAEALVMDYTNALEAKGPEEAAKASVIIEEILTQFINDDVNKGLAQESLYLKYDRDTPLEEVYLKGLKPLPASLQKEKDVIKDAEQALDDALAEARSILKLPSLQYKTVALVTNLIEVPTASEGKVPKHWSVVSRVKAATRYRTEEITHQCAVRTAAAERLEAAARRHFVEHQQRSYGPSAQSEVGTAGGLYGAFNAFIKAIANLDALLSLSILSSTPGYCLPTLYEQNPSAIAQRGAEAKGEGDLILKGLFHPITRARHPNYVSCDVVFGGAAENTTGSISNAEDGGASKRLWLITGPNMGGKSALMRAVALASILAQLGACVPCEGGEAILPVFTSIMGRMGAQDDLIEGSSTFMLEMKETREIVTRSDLSTSLVLMDELGRGTSSYDGLAVADATLKHLLRSGCVCMFVTHYHLLTDWHRGDPRLSLKYMSFVEMDGIEESDDNATASPATHPAKQRKRILFLYQPVDGVTPSSFGIHVAAMAGLPEEILSSAESMSIEAERKHSATRALHVVRTLVTNGKRGRGE